MLRRRRRSDRDPVAEFWSWWQEVRPRVERAIESGEYGSLTDEFTERVRAIDPGLEWELGRGRQADHVLCVTPAGNAELRAVTERWRLAGPEPDVAWEYAAARPAHPETLDTTVTFQGTELALAETRLGVSVDDDRQLVDVVVHHPQFRSMSDHGKTTVSFLVLDWLLGEDGVERWVGAVEVSDEQPLASVPPDAVADVVSSLRERHAEPTWAILDATGPDGLPVLAVARRPLKRVEYPLCDLHGAVGLPFAEQTPVGLPAQPALDRLRAFEDELMSECDEGVLLAAHQTHAGVRTLHLYCDSQGGGRSAVDTFVAKQHWPSARVEWRLDPAWDAIRSYR